MSAAFHCPHPLCGEEFTTIDEMFTHYKSQHDTQDEEQPLQNKPSVPTKRPGKSPSVDSESAKNLEIAFKKLPTIANEIAVEHCFVHPTLLGKVLGTNSDEKKEKENLQNLQPFFPTEILFSKAATHVKHMTEEELAAAPEASLRDERTEYMKKHHARWLLFNKSYTPNDSITDKKVETLKAQINSLAGWIRDITTSRVTQGLWESVLPYIDDHPELSSLKGNGSGQIMRYAKLYPNFTTYILLVFKRKLFSSYVKDGPYSVATLAKEVVEAANIKWANTATLTSVYAVIRDRADSIRDRYRRVNQKHHERAMNSLPTSLSSTAEGDVVPHVPELPGVAMNVLLPTISRLLSTAAAGAAVPPCVPGLPGVPQRKEDVHPLSCSPPEDLINPITGKPWNFDLNEEEKDKQVNPDPKQLNEDSSSTTEPDISSIENDNGSSSDESSVNSEDERIYQRMKEKKKAQEQKVQKATNKKKKAKKDDKENAIINAITEDPKQTEQGQKYPKESANIDRVEAERIRAQVLIRHQLEAKRQEAAEAKAARAKAKAITKAKAQGAQKASKAQEAQEDNTVSSDSSDDDSNHTLYCLHQRHQTKSRLQPTSHLPAPQ